MSCLSVFRLTQRLTKLSQNAVSKRNGFSLGPDMFLSILEPKLITKTVVVLFFSLCRASQLGNDYRGYRDISVWPYISPLTLPIYLRKCHVLTIEPKIGRSVLLIY